MPWVDQQVFVPCCNEMERVFNGAMAYYTADFSKTGVTLFCRSNSFFWKFCPFCGHDLNELER